MFDWEEKKHNLFSPLKKCFFKSTSVSLGGHLIVFFDLRAIIDREFTEAKYLNHFVQSLVDEWRKQDQGTGSSFVNHILLVAGIKQA